MLSENIILESAASELAKLLPSLQKHDYNTIDDLVRNIARKHKISHNALKKIFKYKFKKTPEHWIKGKLDEDDEEHQVDYDKLPIMQEFIRWTVDKINLETMPKFEWSYDTKDAQMNHHTGRHTEGKNDVWVYVKNRNLVDIMRTVFHELVHCRQSELGMIQPGDSYPGSPIEMEADMMAGKYMKVFGKQHPEIFQ
jgi:hypothetical protein